MKPLGSQYEVVEDEFRSLVIDIEQLQCLYDGCRWAEGPVWIGDQNCLLWSDIPNNRILRWSESEGVSTFRAPSNNSNGHTRDRQGRLVSCEHLSRRVTRTEHDGAITVIADAYEGKRLNSPNDVVVKSDGTIWFTDPSYGILGNYEGDKSPQEQEGCFVYCFDPREGSLKVVADDFVKPNGLAFSTDESLLYIADSAYSHGEHLPHHIRVFDVGADNTLSNGRLFADVSPGLPDGFRLDTEGRIWTSAGDGVQCFAPDGRLLGKILTPYKVANLVFGGPKRNRLFICATYCVYAIYVNVQGAKTV